MGKSSSGGVLQDTRWGGGRFEYLPEDDPLSSSDEEMSQYSGIGLYI